MTMSRADKKEGKQGHISRLMASEITPGMIHLLMNTNPVGRIMASSPLPENLRFVVQQGQIWQCHSILWTPSRYRSDIT